MPQKETEQYQKDEERDLERAEEYEHTTMRASAIGTNKFELSTGIIIAARFADKLRRVALVAFGKMVDKNVVLRDVAELNKELYEEIVNKRKIGKLDVIRIIVDAEYDEKENKIKFSNIRIQHFVPEDQCASRENLERLQKENEELRSKLEKIKQMLTAL
ncbi:MAG: DUF2258 domain-containing protein [Sulfolobales archaeon]|nr:DUF2258 domain-containing protein [Sulfolobales archaeon]MCG2884054.1 DUF2258 domain-containing protein [Sulfolobales archaeon]MCG2908653.1 DUF2258 domain-containing protein [Sulfolobales archaeon]